MLRVNRVKQLYAMLSRKTLVWFLALLAQIWPSTTFVIPCSTSFAPAKVLHGIRARSSQHRTRSSLSEISASEQRVDRRTAVVSLVAIGQAIFPIQSSAMSDVEGGKGEAAAEGIRKMASKLPGMGPSDVAYPEEMTGRWVVEQILAGVDFPTGKTAVDPAVAQRELDNVGKVKSFGVRFVRNAESVVADRAFNARQEIAAEEGKDVDVQWKMSNPNVLTVTYPSGEVVERKVTKRSASHDAQTMEFSEYSRIATLSSGGSLMGRGGGPGITARWVRGKLKLAGPGSAEGIVLDYVLPPQQPDPAAATMKLKYRLKLRRVTD